MITMSGEQFQRMMDVFFPMTNKAVNEASAPVYVALQVRNGMLTATGFVNYMACQWKTMVTGEDADLCVPAMKAVKCEKVALEEGSICFDDKMTMTFSSENFRQFSENTYSLFERDKPVKYAVSVTRKTLEQVLKSAKNWDVLTFEFADPTYPVRVIPRYGDSSSAVTILFTPTRSNN